MDEIFSRIVNVSHFQVDVSSKGARLSESEAGGTLVLFAPGHIKISTAWDDNGKVAPEVHLTLSAGAWQPERTGGLVALAQGPFICGADGLTVGNHISGDLADAALPAGQYHAIVFADRYEPMTARRVHVHFIRMEKYG